MKKGYRHRVIVQDRSGSMEEILDGAQAGLKEFLKGEADSHRTGKVTVSLWDFDTEIRNVVSFAQPEDEELRGYRIVPRGGTDLYGATGTAVEAEGRFLAALPETERPEDVTVLVASDGKHNSTHAYTGAQVREMLAHQQDAYGWRVIYMGCGIEAFSEAEQMGVRGGLSVNTARSNTGQANAWKMSSNYLARTPVASAAAAAGQSVVFTDEERKLGESGQELPPGAAGDEQA